jgi:hypothetical protein
MQQRVLAAYASGYGQAKGVGHTSGGEVYGGAHNGENINTTAKKQRHVHPHRVIGTADPTLSASSHDFPGTHG